MHILKYLSTIASQAILKTSRCKQMRSTNHLRTDRYIPLFPTSSHYRYTSTSSSTSISSIKDPSATTKIKDNKGRVSITFVRPDGKKISVEAGEGKSIYDAVIDNNVDIDGFGACEGTLCCTTCHLIFKQEDYEKIGGPSDEELDMLDLAYGLTDRSRLGCQVFLRKEFHPLEVELPASINDVRES